MRITKTHLIALLAAVMLLTAACGGDDSAGDGDDDPGTDASTTSAPDETTAAPTTTEPADTEPPSAEAPDLSGTEWVLITYRLPGTGSITNPWPGSEITAKFDDAGMVSGSTGCNEYSAEFAVSGPYDPFEEGVRDENDGQAVAISITGVTERACEDQDWMVQEGEFLENLTGVESWFIARGNLLLRGEEAFLEFEPAG